MDQFDILWTSIKAADGGLTGRKKREKEKWAGEKEEEGKTRTEATRLSPVILMTQV